MNAFGLIIRGSPTNRNGSILDGYGYWAYINTDGDFIAPLSYFKRIRIKQAGNFKNGRAIVKDHKDCFGMIDEHGSWILQNRYKSIRFLPYTNDSLLETVTAERRYGYAHTSGRIVSPIQYSRVLPYEGNQTWAFTDHMTYLVHQNGHRDSFLGVRKISNFHQGYGGIAEARRLAIIDSNAAISSDYSYKKIGKYAEGKLPAKQFRTYGYLDSDGQWAIQPEYYKAGPFRNGVAMVQYGKGKGNQKYWGFIDGNGRLITGKLNRATDINPYGYATVKKGSSRGIVNARGEIIIAPKYKKIYYGEGFFTTSSNSGVTLRDGNGKKIAKIRGGKVKEGVSDGKLVVKRLRSTGVLDTLGNKILPYSYRNLRPFENGFSLSQYRSTAYIIYQNGDTIATVSGRIESGFRDGLALIRQGPERYIFINTSGKNAFETYYQKATPFVDGFSIIKHQGKYGMIDKEGYFRIQPSYDFIKPPTNQVSIIGISQVAGVCDLNANYVVSPRANKVVYLPQEQVYQYLYKNEFGYFSKSGKMIWEVR